MSPQAKNSKGTVLVTGINGYAASSVALAYLEAGYRVRGTVRSSDKANAWKSKHAQHADSLQFAVVPDSVADGAFDEAVKGVDFVAHTASPVFSGPIPKGENAKALLNPAIHGTLNALRAAHGEPNVKRFVLFSSVAAITNPFLGTRPGYTYTEKDWNPATFEQGEESDNPGFVYLVSKTLAERSAWDFVEEKKPTFSLTAINPSFLFGPPEGPASNLEELGRSTFGMLVKFLTSGGATGPTFVYGAVHVRDVAQAHVKAIEVEASKGQRYILNGFGWSNAETVKFFKSAYPQLADKVAEADPTDKDLSDVYTFDNSKSINELGLTYRSFEQTMRESADVIISHL